MNNNIKEIKIDAGTREFLFTRDECIVIRGILNSLISDNDECKYIVPNLYDVYNNNVPQTSQSGSGGEHIDQRGLKKALQDYGGYLDNHENITLL